MSGDGTGPVRAAEPRLRVTEIFRSLQGEARHAGLETVFVRLTGCPLRCAYCDTAYAFHGGEPMDVGAIVERVAGYRCPRVTVTGGEPLAQRAACLTLLRRLCDVGLEVSIETSGALDIGGIDARVMVVMDWKAPASGESGRNLVANLERLKPSDQLKFVLAGRTDYDWALTEIAAHGLDGRCELLFSPVADRLAPADLADWILEDQAPVRLQLQLHKILWGDVAGR